MATTKKKAAAKRKPAAKKKAAAKAPARKAAAPAPKPAPKPEPKAKKKDQDLNKDGREDSLDDLIAACEKGRTVITGQGGSVNQRGVPYVIITPDGVFGPGEMIPEDRKTYARRSDAIRAFRPVILEYCAANEGDLYWQKKPLVKMIGDKHTVQAELVIN